MNDDLGRGQVGWGTDQWQELDALAADTVSAQVVLRKMVDHQEVSPDVRNVRIAGKNVNVVPITSQAFDFDMEDEDVDDLRRKVREGAQELAAIEDATILKNMKLTPVPNLTSVDSAAFSRAKAELGKKFVQQGFGIVVSPDTLVALETEQVGVRSGLELVEKLLNTTVTQSNALPLGNVQAIVVQVAPPVERITHAAGPRLRVLGLSKGKKITLQLEELVAVGVLEPDRSVSIEK